MRDENKRASDTSCHRAGIASQLSPLTRSSLSECSSLTQHTPGPWFVCGDEGHESLNEQWYEGRTIGSVPHGTRIADVTSLRVREQAFADARLIAAAPDLLEALKQCRSALAMLTSPSAIDCSTPQQAWAATVAAEAKARAAMAKAEGYVSDATAKARVSDGSPTGRDAQRLDGEATTARPSDSEGRP